MGGQRPVGSGIRAAGGDAPQGGGGHAATRAAEMLAGDVRCLRGPGWLSGVSQGCRAAWRPQAAATTETLKERVQTIALEEGREGRLPRPFDYAVAEVQVGYCEMW